MQPGFTAVGRRFEAKAGSGRHPGIFIALGIAILMAGLVMLNIVLPAGVVGSLIQILFILFAIAAGYGTYLARDRRHKKVLLDVERHRLVVDEGRGGIFPLSSAALGLWRSPAVSVISGTVLHLAGGAQTYRVGGLDHRPAAGVRVGAPVSEVVDAYLSKEEFDALLAFVPFVPASADRSAPALVRCPLLPNPWSGHRTFLKVAPVLGTLVLVGLATAGLKATGLFNSLAGQYIAFALIAPILVGGIVLTIVLDMRRGAELVLELERNELRLLDPKTDRVLTAAPRDAIDLTRGMHRIVGDGPDREHAMIAIRMPGWEELTIGVYDMRCGWRDAAPCFSAPPHYMVGTPDWNALIDFFDVRSLVVTRSA
jgi:hypothetical protein